MDEKREQELEEKYRAKIQPPFTVEGVRTHFDPHPFTIGPRHVEVASDRYSGMLGVEVLKQVPCYGKLHGRPCTIDYEGHKAKAVLFIRVPEKLRDRIPEGLHQQLISLKDEIEADGLAGIGFVEPGKSIGRR